MFDYFALQYPVISEEKNGFTYNKKSTCTWTIVDRTNQKTSSYDGRELQTIYIKTETVGASQSFQQLCITKKFICKTMDTAYL